MSRRRRLLAILLFGTTAGYCAFLGYPKVFSGSASYDDEGYLLATFRAYISSGGLYSKTYSQYGPGYYSVFGTLFRILGIDLFSLTPGRVATLVLLVTTSSAGAVAVWLATRRLLVAVAAQLYLFALLRTAVGEPLHPGHYLVFLLALVAVTCFLPRRRWHLVAPVAMGTLFALMITTKVNVGAIAIAGCVLAVGSAHQSRKIRTSACLLLVALPLGLMAGDLTIGPVRSFAAVIVLGAVIAHATLADGPRRAAVDRSTVIAFAGALLIVSAVACVPVMIRGTSVADLFQGAIVAPTRLRGTFSLHYPIDITATPLQILPALVLLGAALVARRIADEPRESQIVGVVKLVGGLVVIGEVAFAPFGALPPSLLLTALGAVPLDRYSDEGLLGRRVLVMIAVLQPLHAYPVAGSQIVWGSFLIGLVAFISVGDGLSEVADAYEFTWAKTRRVVSAPVVVALLLIFAIVVQRQLWPASPYGAYDKLVALDLPGTDGVRVNAQQATLYRSVAHLLASNCDSFYSTPGLNSFFVFAQLRPVTGRNATAWPGLFDDETQRAAVRDLRAFPGRLCVLRNDVQLDEWQQGRPLRKGPLVQYVDGFSVEVGRAGDYVVLRRPASG